MEGLQPVIIVIYIERFSIECRKTKTKVITLANDSRRKQRDEQIRIMIIGMFIKYHTVAPRSELQCVYRKCENLQCLISKLQGGWGYKY